MRKKVREDALRAVVAAVSGTLVFEMLYFGFFADWLGQYWFFRLQLPVIISLVGFISIIGVNFYEYHGFGPQDGIIRHGPNKPYVALTFDDGPNPEFTSRILDILAEKNVRATFFMVGRHVLKYPLIARKVVAEGHEVGNHTFSHRDLMTASRKTLLKEVYDADDALVSTLGIRTRLFRPPRGMISAAGRQVLAENGFTIALWTVSAQDWRRDVPKVMVRRIIRHARPGGIILFHDSGALLRSEGGSRASTVGALPLVIDELRSRGYEFVGLSQLIADVEQAGEESLVEAPARGGAGQEA